MGGNPPFKETPNMTAPPWYLPGHSDHGPRSLVLSSSQRYPEGISHPKIQQKCVESPKNWRFFHQNGHWKQLEAKLITGPNILPKHPGGPCCKHCKACWSANPSSSWSSDTPETPVQDSKTTHETWRLSTVKTLAIWGKESTQPRKRIPIKQRGFHSVIQSVLTNVNRKK